MALCPCCTHSLNCNGSGFLQTELTLSYPIEAGFSEERSVESRIHHALFILGVDTGSCGRGEYRQSSRSGALFLHEEKRVFSLSFTVLSHSMFIIVTADR